MKNKKHFIENTASFLLLAITVVIVFFAHKAAPYMNDDLWYSTNLATGEPLKTLDDVLESQVWHYLNWGGRSMTHTILQLTILCGEAVNNILNVVFTGLLAIIIYIISKETIIEEISVEGSKHIDLGSGAEVSKSTATAAFYVAIIIGMLHGLNPNWLMSMYWQSGSANYLYITVFILLFVYAYIRELPRYLSEVNSKNEIMDKEIKPLKGITVWIVPVAVLSGWSNENMGPTVWLFSVFVIAALKIMGKKIKPWMMLGSILSLVGSLMCILAPGNFVRGAQAEADKSLLWKLVNRVYAEGRAGVDYLYPALIFALLLAVAYYPILKKKMDLRTVVLFAMAVVSWGAMILSPHYPDRACFGTMAFLIIISVSLLLRLSKEVYGVKWWINIAALFTWLRGMFWLLEYMGFLKGIIK
ncbi:MAG: DUF6056 family protein [Lachnospiraceae bacterium]|nr:DUF6056 family protein [Lachnospiraceae bacterium]